MITEVVAALIWDKDKFMICQRPAHKARGLLWEFVGGKVEQGETKEQALIREIKEAECFYSTGNIKNVNATIIFGDTVLEKFSPPSKFAVVIGNEAHGVSDEVLGISDFKVKITMKGRAESLNAAVAAGIAMHWLA